MVFKAVVFLLCAFSAVTYAADKVAGSKDCLLWLENVESKRALSWVKGQNKKTLRQLKNERFKQTKAAALEIFHDKDKLPGISLRGAYVEDFWQDAQHIRGLWRITSITEFKKPTPQWETILDMDALAEAEQEDWVFEGSSCLAPGFRQCYGASFSWR